jgi:hypothetical protein
MLTAIDMYWIHLPIFPSRVSHCIFWTSSLLNFSTPSFCRLCSNVDTRTSLHPQMTPPCSWLNKGKLDDLNHSVMCWVVLHPEKTPCQGEELNWPGFSSLDNWSSSQSTEWFNHTKSFSIKVFTVDHHAPKSSDHNKAPMFAVQDLHCAWSIALSQGSNNCTQNWAWKVSASLSRSMTCQLHNLCSKLVDRMTKNSHRAKRNWKRMV